MSAVIRNEREAHAALDDRAIQRERELADMAAAGMEPWGYFDDADEQQQGVTWPIPFIVALAVVFAAACVWMGKA
jgi:hypothetical protein